MSKLIRFDEDHFGYLADGDVRADEAQAYTTMFSAAWPGKRLIIMRADEFIDLTGQYEIVSVAETAAVASGEPDG